MHILTIQNNVFKYASNWNEFNPDEILFLASLLHNGSTEVEIKIKMLFKCTGIKPVQDALIELPQATMYGITYNKHEWLIAPHELLAASEGFNFLFINEEQEDGTQIPRLNHMLYKNIIGKIKLNGIDYAGPSDALSNLRYDEFIHAETYLDRYVQTEKEEYINNLCAILWRNIDINVKEDNKHTREDIRTPFNSASIEHNGNLFINCEPEKKLAIYYYYLGSRNILKKHFPNVFSGGEASNTDVFRQFMIQVDALSSGDVTKKQAVRSSWLYDVLETMEQNIIARKEMEEKLKK